MRFTLRRAFALAATCLCAHAVAGTSRTYTGPAFGAWSVPESWTPNGVPTTGDLVRIDASSVNNVPGLALSQLTFGSSAELQGNAIGVTAGVNLFSGVAARVVAPLDVGNHFVSFRAPAGTGASLTLAGALGGNGLIEVHVPLRFESPTSGFSGTLIGECSGGDDCGRVTLANASFPGNVVALAGIDGSGTIGALHASGTIKPEGGQLAAASLTLSSAMYRNFLAGKLAVLPGGQVTLDNATLAFESGDAADHLSDPPGSIVRIIDNRGSAPVTGIFNGLPQGTKLDVLGKKLRISYAGGDGNDVTLSVLGEQVISFPQPPDRPYDPLSFSIQMGTGPSGVKVTLTSLTPNVCRTTNSAFNGVPVNVGTVSAGTCTLEANIVGDFVYDDAAPVRRSFQVLKGSQFVSLSLGQPLTVGAPQSAEISKSRDGGPATVSSLTPATCLALPPAGTLILGLHPGSCQLRVIEASTDIYDTAIFDLTVAVQPGTGTIATPQPLDAHVGDVILASVTPSISTGAMVYESGSASCHIGAISPTASAITMLQPGDCIVSVRQLGNADFLPTATVQWTITIAPAIVGTKVDARSDFNGDNRNDLAWQRVDGTTALWMMNGPTQIGGGVLFGAGSGWTMRLLADLNGDGHTDIVWQHADGRVAAWLMNGATQVGGAVLLPANTGWVPVMSGDFNADGKADIVWVKGDGTIALWLMDGTAQVGGGVLFGGGSGWSPAFVADFNGDGAADILWTHVDGRSALWLMNGASQAGGAVLLPAGTGYAPRLVGDFNGDGKADVVWQHADGRTAMWLMNGTTQAAGTSLLGAGTGWHVTRTGDLNGDGRADLVWQKDDGTVAVWLMNGIVQVGGGIVVPAGSGWTVRRVADFSGDGIADLVMQSIDGRFAMWVMQGASSAMAPLLDVPFTGWVLAP